MKRKDFSKLKIHVQKEKNTYFKHEDFIAGVAPNLRGIYASMYFQTPLIIEYKENLIPEENQTPEIELANFLAKSLNYIKNGIDNKKSIDNVISQLSFETTIGKNQFNEIAKMRAARILWAKMVKQFNPKNQESFALKINVQIHNSIDIFPVVLGGCQSIITDNTTNLNFVKETFIFKTIDPLAGSTFIEKRTEDIANNAWQIFVKKTNFLNS